MKTTLIVLMGALLLAAGALLPKLKVAEDSKSLGSITEGQEYNATTTKPIFGAGAAVALSRITKATDSGVSGTLGSVIITASSTANSIINIFDATSTVQLSSGTDWATTTLARIDQNTPAGTYVFDVAYKRGLVLQITGVVPTSTITWR